MFNTYNFAGYLCTLCLAHSSFLYPQGMRLETAHRADWPLLVWGSFWSQHGRGWKEALVEILCSEHSHGEQTVPSQVLNSSKDGDYTISVGNLFHSDHICSKSIFICLNRISFPFVPMMQSLNTHSHKDGPSWPVLHWPSPLPQDFRRNSWSNQFYVLPLGKA